MKIKKRACPKRCLKLCLPSIYSPLHPVNFFNSPAPIALKIIPQEWCNIFPAIAHTQITAMIAAKVVTAIASVTVTVVAIVRIIHGFLSDRRTEESGLPSQTNNGWSDIGDIGAEHVIENEDDGSFHRLLTSRVPNLSDDHQILHVTMAELARALHLKDCIIWMPIDNQPRLTITHSIKLRRSKSPDEPLISLADETVQMVLKEFKVTRIPLESELARHSCAWTRKAGVEIDYVFAVRLPLLNISTYCCELLEPKDSSVFAVIVLVVPRQAKLNWGIRETAIVQAAVNQVIITLSHVNVMEESLIAREDLKQQIIALEFSKQARNDLIKVIDHVMRTPLRAIGALSSLLSESNLDEGDKYIVGMMQRSSKVISGLMDEVFDFSRLENDGLRLNSDRILLPKLIHVAEILLKPAATSKGLRLIFSGHENLPRTVIGDEIKILHVLLSIVGNAIEFTERGNIRVDISTELQNDKENDTDSGNSKLTSNCAFIHFQVKNTDIGINATITPLQFNISDEEHSDIAGSDLGFSNSEKFLKLMKGKIWIESEGGEQGTTCHFCFQVKIINS